MDTNTLQTIQGELERLFDLEAMKRLSADVLGFDPDAVGEADSKGAFARSLIGHCAGNDALHALVDAIMLSSRDADRDLPSTLHSLENGELKPGTIVGDLKVVKKIAEGGLSHVYLAESKRDGGPERRAALKVIRHEYARDRVAVRRFTTVARIMQQLQDEGLADIVGVGELEDHRPWVAATFLQGQTLAARIARTGGLHMNEARPVLEGVLHGLSALHGRGIIHGDIKAENVYIVRRDGAREPTGVLVDAGTERLLTRVPNVVGSTGLLPVLGTAKSVAPEQARGQAPDVRSDIYAFGTLMYEALTGQPVFEGQSAIDVIAQHLSAEPEPPSAHARKGWASDAIDAVVLRALSKDPDDRFQSVEALLEAIDQAARKPAKARALDEAKFSEARAGLIADPANTDLADEIENMAKQADAWARAAEVYMEAAGGAEGEEKLTLLLRAARVHELETRDAIRAEAAYQQVLELDEDNDVALRGVEAARRAAADHEGLVEILLERMERSESVSERLALLSEAATIYEEDLDDQDNAFIAWLQALATAPEDADARRAVERLASAGGEARWNEAVQTLTEAVQDTINSLHSDRGAELAEAQSGLAQAEATLAQYRAHYDGVLKQRQLEADAAQAAASEEGQAAGEAVEALRAQYEALASRASEYATAAEAALVEVERLAEADETARLAAEEKVDAYETLEAEAGEAPDEAQAAQLEQLADEAESLVDAAGAAEEALAGAQAALEEANAAANAAQADADAMLPQLEAAERALDDAELGGADIESVEASLTEEEQAQLLLMQQQVAEARELVDALAELDDEDVAAQRERDVRDAVALYNLMGSWYAQRLGRNDVALPCYSQALALQPGNDEAYDGITDLYRESQAWAELATLLLQRADSTRNPVKSRDYRADAAVIILHKLGDPDTAAIHFDAVLADDPANATAQEALAEVLMQRQDWPALVELLGKRVSGQDPEEQVETLILMAELNEDQLQDLERAQVLYEQVIDIDARNLSALKGLERLYARSENFGALLRNLRTQVDVAATPKQRIGLLERVGLMQEEEFVDHAGAAATFEEIIAIDASHDAANTALARLYRQMSRFEDVVETLDRHASAVADDGRRIDLLLQAVRVLTVDIGSPDRAIEMCERVLTIDEEHAEALAEVARLKSTAGDTRAAVDAVERLAEKEQDAVKQSELWIRAAKMLDDSGDRDGAISRYKRALDVNKQAADAADALREIYAKRGDAYGAVEMLQQAIDMTEGEHKRASLYAELGTLYRERLDDPKEAQDAFMAAIDLDASNTVAVTGLAALAFERKDFMEAAEYYDAVMGRLDEFPAARAARVAMAAAEAFGKTDATDKALSALKRAAELAPDELEVVEAYAMAVAASGDGRAAEKLLENAYRQFEDRLELHERVRMLVALGEAQLQGRRARQAIETAKRALDMRPDDDGALDLLTRGHEASRNWDEVINLLQQRSRRADGEDERFDLLVRTADVFLEHIRDRDAAAQTYVMALDVKPESRNILTKLMGVYSDKQDWPRLIEVILRIADMVDDAVQLSKYFNTAATIAHHELGRFDEAANYYEAALSHLPPGAGDMQFQGLVQCLTQNQDWERLERAYETRVDRLQVAGADPKAMAQVLDAHAEVVRDHQGRLADALHLFEQAQALDPDNRDRRAMLTAIYTKEPKRFFKRAVAAHRAFLDEDPFRIESMQALRKIYTSGKKPDESWCICQALRSLKMADPEEEKFFKKYRLTRLAKAKHPLDEDAWRTLLIHPLQDPALTGIFAALSPAVIATQTQPLSAFGVGPQHRADPTHDNTAMGRMLAHVGDSVGMRLPEVYHCPQDSGGLSFLFSAPPAIGIGQGAAAGGPQQALAFVAARHLSYYRGGNFLRHLVPTGTGLRAWLMAAIRTVSPQFAVPPAMENQVRECGESIKLNLTGPQRDTLRSMTQKLLDAAPELDMKRWMAGVDLTADRVGFLLSNDLKISQAVIEASPEDSSTVARKERLRELLSYAISEPYFEVRKRIGIALGR